MSSYGRCCFVNFIFILILFNLITRTVSLPAQGHVKVTDDTAAVRGNGEHRASLSTDEALARRRGQMGGDESLRKRRSGDYWLSQRSILRPFDAAADKDVWRNSPFHKRTDDLRHRRINGQEEARKDEAGWDTNGPSSDSPRAGTRMVGRAIMSASGDDADAVDVKLKYSVEYYVFNINLQRFLATTTDSCIHCTLSHRHVYFYFEAGKTK